MLRHWGFFKNKTKRNEPSVIDGQKWHVRTKSLANRGAVQSQAPSLNLIISPASTSRESLIGFMRENVGQFFPQNVYRGVTNLDVLIPSANNGDATWQAVFHQCQAVSVLARVGMSPRLNFALQQLFRNMTNAAAEPSSDFFIYFWRIAISLRDIRCHGEQKLQRNKHVLLSTLLKYLRFLFSLVYRNHPFAHFVAWLDDALHEAPLEFKAVMQWAYASFILCLKKAIGEYHPIILGMMAYHEKNWRTNNSYKSTSIRMHYDGYIRKAETERKDTTLLALEYMDAMSVSEYEDDFRQTGLLASSMRQKTRPDPGSQLGSGLRVQVFIHSTDWLANEHYKRNDNRCYEVLADAINILRCGDQICRIWAATFSRRKALWHKSTINYKVARKDEMADSSNALPIHLKRLPIKRI